MTQLSEHEIAGISGLLMQMRRLIHAYIEEKDYELPEGEKPLIAAVLHAVDSAYLNLDPDPMGELRGLIDAQLVSSSPSSETTRSGSSICRRRSVPARSRSAIACSPASSPCGENIPSADTSVPSQIAK